MIDNKPSFSRSRKWGISFNVIVSTVALFAMVLMLNYLAARQHWRIPLSERAQTGLSSLTKQVLGGVTNPVKVVVFFEKQEPLFDSVWALLKEYQFACPQLSIEAVDYISDPTTAAQVRLKYKLGAEDEKDCVIFACQDRTRIVNSGELSELDLEPLMSRTSQEVKRTHFKGEMMFTAAIQTVTNPRRPKAFYVQGHREHSLESDQTMKGYSAFHRFLKDNNNVEVEPLRLDGPNEIPECQLVIIAGPIDPFVAEELAKLDRYLKQGGRLWVLLNYEALERPLGLEKFLENWGVGVSRNVVEDPERESKGNGIMVSEFGAHPITKPLRESRLRMLLPRAVIKAKTVSGSDAPQVELLATTSSKGRVLTDIRDGAFVPSANDFVGTVPLMAAVEKGGLRGVTADRGATRLLVLGDSFFLGNEFIDEAANWQFAHLALNWLLARNELLAGLAPRPITGYKLTVTKSEMAKLRLGLLAGLPGAVLVIGALVRLRRRH